MPGVGEDAGAWMSYAAAKRQQGAKQSQGIDRRPDAARPATCRQSPATSFQRCALGVPGSAPSAVLMAAMIIHGIQRGHF